MRFLYENEIKYYQDINCDSLVVFVDYQILYN